MSAKLVHTDIKLIIGPVVDQTDGYSLKTSFTYGSPGRSIYLVTEKLDGTIANVEITPTMMTFGHYSQGRYWLTIPAATNTCEGTVQAFMEFTDALPSQSEKYTITGPDTAARDEALKQGYRPNRDVIVEYSTTATGRGTNLKAAQAVAKAISDVSGDTAASAVDRITVFLPPWDYAIGSVALAADTNYIDFIALYPEPGSKRSHSDMDSCVNSDNVPGFTSLESFRPPRTVVYGDSNAVHVINQSAQIVKMSGFAVAQLYTADMLPNIHALYVSAESNKGSHYDLMYCWHKQPVDSHSSPIGFAKHVDGVYDKVIANACSFRVGYDDEDEGEFRAAMYDCQGGYQSIIGDYQSARIGTHKAVGCHVVRCDVIGGYESIKIGSFPIYGAGFSGCSTFSLPLDSDCYFQDCYTDGSNSFCIGAKSEAFYLRCVGRESCFAATTDTTSTAIYTGEMAGTAIDCISFEGGFGGRLQESATELGSLTGTLRRCTCIGNSQATRAEGATVDDCLFTVDTTGVNCFELLDDTSHIHDSTLLVLEGGSGVPIYSAAAQNVSASGNRYNNVGEAAQGLGSNVTNVAPVDVETDAASRTASKATSVTVSEKTGFSLAADQRAVTIGVVSENTDMRGTDSANTTNPDVAGTAAALYAAIPTAAEIWTEAGRTLSGTAAANGPTAATASTDGIYTVPVGGTLGLYKRVRHWSGDDITQADIASITYSIYGLDRDNEDTRNEVTGHVDSAVSISATIYDTVQTDSAASDYNFKFIPSIVTYPAFDDAGTTYLIEFTITPTSGEVITERFQVTAI